MNVYIEKVILWHNDTARFAPRVVDFSMRPKSKDIKGVVHLILGDSGTGKTALLHVIDYCLGADKSSIPMDRPYRELVQWYGLMLRINKSDIYLIARGAPSGGQADKYYFEALHSTLTPDWLIEPNMGREQFLVRFGEILGMDMELYSDEEDHSASEEEVMVTPHDFTPLLLMPADYLIRAEGLFYTRYVKMPALRRAMPIALGAATRDAVLLKLRQAKVKRQMNANRKKLQEMLENAGGAQHTLSTTYSRAVQMGLVAQDIEGELNNREMISRLEQMYQTLSESSNPDTSMPVLEQLRLLRASERNLRRRLTAISRQLNEVRRLLEVAGDASATMAGATVRLRAFDWFKSHAGDEHSCPICGSMTRSAQAELARIGQSVDQHRSEVRAIQSIDTDYRAREAELEQAYMTAKSALDQASAAKLRLSELLNVDGTASQIEVTLAQIERVVAGTEAVIASRLALERLDRLQATYLRSQDELARADRQLDVFSTLPKSPERDASVREHIELHAKDLVLSHADEDIQFSLETLELQFGSSSSGAKQTRIKVKQIGGAANWMGYNIAVHLALHDKFAAEQESPVPSFLVIDQFSVAEANRAGSATSRRPLTQRVFDALAYFARVRDAQVIVLASIHDRDQWSPRAGEAIIEVDRWESADGVGLIPAEWLE